MHRFLSQARPGLNPSLRLLDMGNGLVVTRGKQGRGEVGRRKTGQIFGDSRQSNNYGWSTQNGILLNCIIIFILKNHYAKQKELDAYILYDPIYMKF